MVQNRRVGKLGCQLLCRLGLHSVPVLSIADDLTERDAWVRSGKMYLVSGIDGWE